jgi:hypothetical protein
MSIFWTRKPYILYGSRQYISKGYIFRVTHPSFVWLVEFLLSYFRAYYVAFYIVIMIMHCDPWYHFFYNFYCFHCISPGFGTLILWQ